MVNITKITRIDGWLDVVYEYPVYLEFKGHSIEEANDLYQKFLLQEKNTTEWISVKDRKPEQDCLCYVMNSRGVAAAFVAFYHKRYDVFKLYDPKAYDCPCLDVTHWYPLPHPYVEDY